MAIVDFNAYINKYLGKRVKFKFYVHKETNDIYRYPAKDTYLSEDISTILQISVPAPNSDAELCFANEDEEFLPFSYWEQYMTVLS